MRGMSVLTYPTVLTALKPKEILSKPDVPEDISEGADVSGFVFSSSMAKELDKLRKELGDAAFQGPMPDWLKLLIKELPQAPLGGATLSQNSLTLTVAKDSRPESKAD